MKHILLALIVAGLFGCSSSPKSSDHAHDAVSDEAKAAIESAAEDLKNAAAEAEETAETEVAKAEEAVESTTDGFSAYEGTEASKVTCTLGEDVRTISVLNGATGGCGVVYNKMGVDKTIAVANNLMDYCGQTMEKVKGNLTSAGFNCL